MKQLKTVTLYHGTTPEAAKNLILNGWRPNDAPVGGNCGQSRYLYLSTEREDALWFALEKGSDTVLVLEGVPVDSLVVDPEDGTYDTVEEELASKHGLPGKVALTVPLDASFFAISVPGTNLAMR